MVTLLHLTPADYQISTWSGGQTTQLFLSPEGGSYPDRTFDFRLSTATVEVEKNVTLPISRVYHRILMPLNASIRLTHHHKEVVLNPRFKATSLMGEILYLAKGLVKTLI